MDNNLVNNEAEIDHEFMRNLQNILSDFLTELLLRKIGYFKVAYWAYSITMLTAPTPPCLSSTKVNRLWWRLTGASHCGYIYMSYRFASSSN